MSEGQSIFDKAKDMASNVKDKVTGAAGENQDKLDSAVERGGDLVDQKTGDKYSGKVDKAQDAAHRAVDELAGQDDPEGQDEPRL